MICRRQMAVEPQDNGGNNMKKMISFLLCLALVLALTGCAGTTVVVGNCTCPPEIHENIETPTAAPVEGALMTGLAIVPKISGSASATSDANGKADYDVTIVAVTVDDKGIIRDCIIDSIGASAEFDAAGTPVTPGTVDVLTKTELGYDYGMVKYGASTMEWFEQAAAVAEYAVGKTVEELKNGAVNESGTAKDADLATKATIYIGGYISGIEAAVANAKALGAEAGHELKLAVVSTLDTSAGQESGGAAQLNLDAVALTMNGETITSCTIDSLQAQVAFDGTGMITTDLSAAPKTKTELGYDYGMVKFGASTMEWFEQVENFCAYVTGKTAAEVAGIAVTETTAPADADLATGTTIAIGTFQKLIAKAAG